MIISSLIFPQFDSNSLYIYFFVIFISANSSSNASKKKISQSIPSLLNRSPLLTSSRYLPRFLSFQHTIIPYPLSKISRRYTIRVFVWVGSQPPFFLRSPARTRYATTSIGGLRRASGLNIKRKRHERPAENSGKWGITARTSFVASSRTDKY